MAAKAEKSQLDDILQRMMDEFQNSRGATEKTLGLLRRRLEKTLLDALSKKPEEPFGSSGTTRCLLCQRAADPSPVLDPGRPAYNPQTGRYYLPKIGTSKGSGDVFRGGFRMPLEGTKEARIQQERDLMSRSLTDLQFAVSNPAVQSSHPPNRQFKWTGNIQMFRDNPNDLWRPHTVATNKESMMKTSPIAVGYDSRVGETATS